MVNSSKGCYEWTTINSSICTDVTNKPPSKKNSRKLSTTSLETFSPQSRCFEFLISERNLGMCMEFKIEDDGIAIEIPNVKNKVFCKKSL